LETIYDWLSVAVFGVLVVLFLHRSAMPEPEPMGRVLFYLPPALGCAVANYAGNHGQDPLSITLLVAVVIYIVLVLKPFGGFKL
jgi:hypothetical protein